MFCFAFYAKFEYFVNMLHETAATHMDLDNISITLCSKLLGKTVSNMFQMVKCLRNIRGYDLSVIKSSS